MYTVVVCSNCKHVWIAKDRPKTSKCRKCERTRKFSKLKKYYQDEDLAAAKLARAQVQARVNDQEDRFEDALERGVLHQEIDSVFDKDEYISGQGVDAEAVHDAVERMLDSPDATKSRREIVVHGIRKQDEPTLSEFIDYAESYGLNASDAVLYLEKLVRSGRLSLPSQISLSELEATSQDLLESNNGESATNETATDDQQSTNNQREILVNGITEAGSDPEAVVGYAVERGMSPEKAVLRLEKLIRMGDSAEIGLADVEAVAADILNEDHTTPTDETESTNTNTSTNNGQSQSNHRTRSRADIMADAIRDKDAPTRTDVIQYATDNGIPSKKAERYLQKMLRNGEVTENTDNELRLL